MIPLKRTVLCIVFSCVLKHMPSSVEKEGVIRGHLQKGTAAIREELLPNACNKACCCHSSQHLASFLSAPCCQEACVYISGSCRIFNQPGYD